MTPKEERKIQDRLNRINNLMVGQDRIWTLQRIARWTEHEADILRNPEPMRRDALFLDRLAWDLEAMHDAAFGRRPSLDRMGPRP